MNKRKGPKSVFFADVTNGESNRHWFQVVLCLFKSRAHQSVLLNGAAFVRVYTTWINVQDKDKKTKNKEHNY